MVATEERKINKRKQAVADQEAEDKKKKESEAEKWDLCLPNPSECEISLVHNGGVSVQISCCIFLSVHLLAWNIEIAFLEEEFMSIVASVLRRMQIT